MKNPGHDRVIEERKERIRRMEADIADAKLWLAYCYDRNCECWVEYRGKKGSST